MLSQQPILIDTMTFDTAGGAATQYAVLAPSTTGDNYCRMPAAAAAIPVGVAQEALGTTVGTTTESSLGHGIAVMKAGVAIVKASAAIAVGVPLGVSGTTGKVRTAVSSDYIVGVSLDAAAADGDLIRCMLSLPGIVKA